MKGAVVVTHGYNGWGNRKSGCEAYGPGGRWHAPKDRASHADGDLLGDHLDELGCHEGSKFLVVACTNRFDTAEFENELRPLIEACVEAYRHGVRTLPDYGPQFGEGE